MVLEGTVLRVFVLGMWGTLSPSHHMATGKRKQVMGNPLLDKLKGMPKADVVPSLPPTQNRISSFLRQKAGELETQRLPVAAGTGKQSLTIARHAGHILHTKTLPWAVDVAQLAERLPSMHKALHLVPSAPQNSTEVHASNPSTGSRCGGSEVQCQ